MQQETNYLPQASLPSFHNHPPTIKNRQAANHNKTSPSILPSMHLKKKHQKLLSKDEHRAYSHPGRSPWICTWTIKVQHFITPFCAICWHYIFTYIYIYSCPSFSYTSILELLLPSPQISSLALEVLCFL